MATLARPMCGRGPACSPCSATTSVSWAPRMRPSRASADHAPSGWTGSWAVLVWGGRRKPRCGGVGWRCMESLLIRSCEVGLTMNDAGTEVRDGSVLIEDGVISWVGTGSPPRPSDARVIDGRGLVATPGLINTHHHLYQSLTRVRAQEAGLFDWLRELYPVWATIDADWERTAAEVGLAELALSGCSTTTDHHYVFPSGSTGLLEAEIEVAA